MTNNTVRSAIAKFAPFDASDFNGETIKPAVFERQSTSDEQSVADISRTACRRSDKLAMLTRSGDADRSSVRKSKKHKRSGNKADKSAKPAKQAEIDLADPSQVAEAMARYQSLNSSILEMAVEKVHLEDELKDARSRLEEAEEALSMLSEEFEQQNKMLKFATDHGIVGFKILGRRFLEGFAAVAGGSIVFAYLFF